MPEPVTPLIRMYRNLITEKEFQATVVEYAQARGWKVAHFRPAMTSRLDKKGKPVWVTPVQADGEGFVDLVLVRFRIVYAEVKSETGKLSKQQEGWRDAIVEAGGEWYCWKPSDWPEIEDVLA